MMTNSIISIYITFEYNSLGQCSCIHQYLNKDDTKIKIATIELQYENSRLVKYVTKADPYFFEDSITEYKYNNSGFIESETYKSVDDPANISYTVSYCNYKQDEHQNWTSRTVSINGHTIGLQTRSIQYE